MGRTKDAAKIVSKLGGEIAVTALDVVVLAAAGLCQGVFISSA